MMRRVRSGAGWSGRPAVVAFAAMLAAVALTGCTGDDPGLPSAGGTPTGTATTAPDMHAQELEFVTCMRNEGVADMPDPVPGDTSGRSAVRYALDVMGKGSDPLFQAALQTCMDRLPEVADPEPPTSEELEALQAFARCMRENGLTDFADLGGDSQLMFFYADEPHPAVTMIDQESGVGEIQVVNLGDPVAAAAFEACKHHFPQSGDE